jgi:hypothetical protein
MVTAAEAPPIRKQLDFFPDLPMSKTVSRFDKISATRKANTQARVQRINDRFDHLYNVERKRYDDVITELCREFNCVVTTIEKALKG